MIYRKINVAELSGLDLSNDLSGNRKEIRARYNRRSASVLPITGAQSVTIIRWRALINASCDIEMERTRDS